MWFGTRDGLNRFDGYKFEVLQYNGQDSSSISNNDITSLLVDKNGDIWAGTSFGLNKINAHTLQAKAFYHWFENPYAISSNKIRTLAEDQQGRIWIGTNNGLNRLDDWEKNDFKKYTIDSDDPYSLSNNAVNDILIDSKGRIWVGTDGGLNLYRPETNDFKRFRFKFEDDNSLSNNLVQTICEDLDGNLWIGTKYGLNKYNPEMDVFTRYFAEKPKAGLIASNIINEVKIDDSGDLWVGTPSGLSRISHEMSKSIQYNTIPGKTNTLPNDHILSLFIGSSDMIWVGTNSAGVATLDLSATQFYSVVYSGQDGFEPEENQIYSFFEADTNHFWVGTGRGLVIYNHYSDTSFFFANSSKRSLGKISKPVLSFAKTADGIYWLGTDGGGLVSYRFSNDSLVSYTTQFENPYSISSNTINDIKVSGNDNLWIATAGGGLCYFDRVTKSFRTYRFDGADQTSIRDNNVNCIAVDSDENVWFGTGNSGLYFLNVKTDELKNYTAGNIKEGLLPSNSINQLYLDSSDQLWIASSGGGLSKYIAEKGYFETYNANNGLSNNVVLGLTADGNGNLWMSTNGGITTFNVKTETFRNYNEQEVLGQNTFYPRSCLHTSSDLLIFGGSNGFDYLNTRGIQENHFIPPVVITTFQLMDRRDHATKLDLLADSPEKVVLEYNHSGFTIEFAALNFEQSSKNQYAYRLKGLFDQWRYIGNRHFATFSNLSPGTYIFEVKGSNNDGYWNEEPSYVRIVVRPAYWQTSWFQILIIVSIMFALYLFYKYKLSSEKERNQQLESAVKVRTTEISRERDTNAILLKEVHHRVKNNLQIIVSLLNLQSRFISDSKLLNVFSEIQNRVRSMSLIHEKMYKTKDLKTVNIEEYITDLSQSLLSTYRLGQKVHLDIQVEVNRFHSDTLTPLGLIINEVISNALKYAFQEDKTGTIIVRLTKLENGRFILIIGDDGIGIPKDIVMGETESFGTELISALSEQLNGTIKLLDDVKGTVYEVEFEDVA